MTLPVRHFYHLYAAGDWQQPWQETVAALTEARLDCPFEVGIVGSPDERAPALTAVSALDPVRVSVADVGFEQVTFAMITEWLETGPPETAVIYAHTKGARYPHGTERDWMDVWRRSMTRHLIGGWQQNVGHLEAGYDTVGSHWLTSSSDQHNGMAFYGGNFWMARSSYLRRLPPYGADRYDAEVWIGSGDPKAFDLNPGWPSRGNCLP